MSGVAGVRKGQPLHKSHWAGEAPQEASCRFCLRIVGLVPSPQARERCVWVSALHPRWQPGALTCTWAWVLSPDTGLPLVESGALSFARMTGSVSHLDRCGKGPRPRAYGTIYPSLAFSLTHTVTRRHTFALSPSPCAPWHPGLAPGLPHLVRLHLKSAAS